MLRLRLMIIKSHASAYEFLFIASEWHDRQQLTAKSVNALQFRILDFGINWKFVFLIFVNKSSLIHIWQLSWLKCPKFTFARMEWIECKFLCNRLMSFKFECKIECFNSNCTDLSSEFRLPCINKKLNPFWYFSYVKYWTKLWFCNNEMKNSKKEAINSTINNYWAKCEIISATEI